MARRAKLEIPFDIEGVTISRTQYRVDYKEVYVHVENDDNTTMCPECEATISCNHGVGKELKLRHTSVLGMRCYVYLKPKRAKCKDCGITSTQKSDWYTTKSPHTRAFDNHLLRLLVNGTVWDVSETERVGYDAVEGTVKRHLPTNVNWDDFDDLQVIGIDEIAVRKGKGNYVAIVTTRQASGQVAVLAVLENRKKDGFRLLDVDPSEITIDNSRIHN